MPYGFVVSLLFHGGLLVWAFVSMQSTKPLHLEETQAITVAIITPSELTRLKQGDPDAKKLEAKAKDEPKPEISKKEAPKPKPIEAPSPPAATEPPAVDPIADKLAALPKEEPKPAPGPTPAEIAKQKAALEAAAALAAKKKAAEEAKKKEDAKKKLEEKKKAEAKKKSELEKKRKAEALRKKRLAEKRRKAAAAKKKKQFDADRIAALIDKSPDKRGAPRSSRDPSTPTDYDGPTAGERRGRDNVLSAREEDLLKGAVASQLRDCWRLPGGGGGIETVVVTLQWRLNQDGSLDGEPRVQNPRGDAIYRIASEAAVRAVKQCSPFRLPPDKYTSWSSITWNFDPREML